MPRPETVQLWRQRIERFDAANITVTQFCRREGVSQPAFYPGVTGVPPLTPGRISKVLQEAIAKGQPSIKANFWGYYASRLPVVGFDFTVSRHRDGPDEVLSDYEGNLIGDCWSGFQKNDIRSDSRITFAADLDSEAMRFPSVLPKSKVGEAAAYVRRHWESLCRFTADASIPLDNNDCEQLMKRVATGRKNWCAPDVLSRTSGRTVGSGGLVGNAAQTVPV